MEKTCIIYGSSTGTCQAIAENIAGKLGVGAADVLDVSSIDASTPDAYTNLILGTSTWGAGELQDDWYDGLEALKQANLAGKTIALFGCMVLAFMLVGRSAPSPPTRVSTTTASSEKLLASESSESEYWSAGTSGRVQSWDHIATTGRSAR